MCCYCLQKMQKCVVFKALCSGADERKFSPNVNLCLLCSTLVKEGSPQSSEDKLIQASQLAKYIPLVIFYNCIYWMKYII